MNRTLLTSLTLFALLAIAIGSAQAGRIGLTWQASDGASGYRVYYGLTEGNYFNEPLYDGPATTVEVADVELADCTTWHFAVTAYNLAGESEFSTDVASWTRPEVADASPGETIQGDQVVVTIQGSGFSPDAVFSVDNPGVLLDNATVNCDSIQVLATIEPTTEGVQPAEIGEFTITVVNPDGLSDTLTRGLEVEINPARFDVNKSSESTQGRLDGLDTVWMATIFGSQDGDFVYDPDFDFDGDGWVDGTDLAYLGSNFGRCWDGAAWKASACE